MTPADGASAAVGGNRTGRLGKKALEQTAQMQLVTAPGWKEKGTQSTQHKVAPETGGSRL